VAEYERKNVRKRGAHSHATADVARPASNVAARHSSLCLARLPALSYTEPMTTLTVRLPEALVAEIERESRGRRCSKSDIVRERLQRSAPAPRHRFTPFDAIADLVGSVDGLPTDLSARKKRYLKSTSYGQKHAR
jgi:hypothetical protein